MELVCAGCLKKYNLMGAPGKQFRCKCGNKLTLPKGPVKDQFGIVQCSGCWTRYSVAGRKSGAKFKCRNCGNIVTIRNTGTTAPQPPVNAELDEAQTQVIPLENIRQKESSPAPSRPASGRTRTSDRKSPSEARGRAARPRRRPPSAAGTPASQRAASPPAQSAASGGESAFLRQEITSLKQQSADLNRKLEEVSRSRDRLEETLNNKEGLLNAKDGEIQALNERLARMEQDKAALDGRLKKAAKQTENLNQKLSSLEQDVSERDSRISSLEKTVEELNGKIEELNDELANRVTREETVKFREEKAQTEKMVSDISNEIAGTREALRDILGKANSLTGEITALQDDAGKFDKVPDVLKELDEERAGVKKLQDENKTLREQLQKNRRHLDEAKKGLQEAAEREQQMLQAQDEHNEGLFHRGAAKILGMFGGRGEDVAAGETVKTAGRRARSTQGLPAERGDVVQPDEVADLGDEMPAPEPLPVDDDEVLSADPEDEIPPIEAAQRAALSEGPPAPESDTGDESSPDAEAAPEPPDDEEDTSHSAPTTRQEPARRRRSRLERYK